VQERSIGIPAAVVTASMPSPRGRRMPERKVTVEASGTKKLGDK
jgi:hypothetical protein